MDFVAFSGGKDSTALALLLEDSIPVFTDTGWEFDEVYQHIDKFEQTTGREVIRIQSKRGALPDYIRESKFMPGHGARFCTRMFKIEPMNEFLKSQLPATLNIGLRADEPASERVGNLTEIDGLSIRYPMRELGMDRFDVIKLCMDYGLLPRYPPYMARGGCKGCFYKRAAEVRALIHIKPDVADELEQLEGDVQAERNEYAIMFPNTGCKISDMRRQPLLFNIDEVYAQASDTSDYGRNCGLFCNR